MRINPESFKKYNCQKCKQFANDKPVFGKCFATKSNMLVCARMRLFNGKEFEEYTGIEINRRGD